MSEPKIVIFDLETIPDVKAALPFWPRLSAYPGLTLKASINTIACIGYQIYGEKKIHCLNAWDYPNWDKNVNAEDFMRIIAIEWLDACSDASWVEIGSVLPPTQKTRSVGFLVSENDIVVTIAHTWDEETNHVNGLMHIPKAMILKRSYLWRPAKRKS